MWFPCGSLELHWDDSAGTLQKKGMFSCGERGLGESARKQCLNEVLGQVSGPCTHLGLHSLLHFRWSKLHLGLSLHHLHRMKDVLKCLPPAALYILSQLFW